MASKICPSCGAKNPSTAYSCSNCAASLIDFSSPSTSTTSYSSQNPTSQSTTDEHRDFSSENSLVTRSSSSEQSQRLLTAEQPIVTVKQSVLSGVVNALVTSLFFLFFGFSFGLGSFLYQLIYAVAVIAIPFGLWYFFRPNFEFFDTYFKRVSRTGSQSWEYSNMESVSERRSRIMIFLKSVQGEIFGHRPITIPGNVKFAGTDLASWLKSKIPPAKQDQNEHKELNEEPNS